MSQRHLTASLMRLEVLVFGDKLLGFRVMYQVNWLGNDEGFV